MQRLILKLTFIFIIVSNNTQAIEVNDNFDSPFSVEISQRNYTDVVSTSGLNERESSLALQWRPLYTLGELTLRGDLWQENRDGDVSEKTNQSHISELSFNYPIGEITSISGGRSLIVEGSGYIWNPANPFNDYRLNIKDRARQFKRDGDPYLLLESFFDQFSLTLIATEIEPIEKISNDSKDRLKSAALRLNTIFDQSDITFTVANIDDSAFISTSFSSTPTDQLEIHAELAGRESNIRHFPEAIPSETSIEYYQLTQIKADETHVDGLVGFQYTFENQLNIILEYLHNGSGYNKKDFKKLLSAIEYSQQRVNDPITGPAHIGFLTQTALLTGLMRKHYWFARVSAPDLLHNLEASIFTRYASEDSSHIDGMYLQYELTPYSKIKLDYERITGKKNSEAGLIPYESATSLSLIIDF